MTAVLLPQGKQQYFTATGAPLVGGRVLTYDTGTTTPRTTWADGAQTVPNANPVILDARGEATIFWQGAYRVRVEDSLGNHIWTQDGVSDLAYGTAAVDVLRQQLASAVSGSDGSRMIGFRRTEAGSVSQTIYDRMRQSLSVRDFGAVGDGVANDAPAFALAIAAAVAIGAAVYIPPPNAGGYYKWNTGVTIPLTANFRMFGAGKTVSIIKPGAAITNMLTIGTAIGQQIRGSYEGFQLDLRGAFAVQRGIYGERVEEHDFELVSVYGATVSNWSIGYGYVNNYNFCEASYGTGDGFATNNVHLGGGANNTNNYFGCLALTNDGFGMRLERGYGIRIFGCTIETNKKGGIWANVMKSLYINAYFEGNGVNGNAFTTPAQTVRADIILVGSGNDTDMSAAFVTDGVTVDTCNTLPLVTSNAFVWNAGANNVTVRNCYTQSPGFVPCVTEMYNNAYKGTGTRIEGCSSFTTQISQIGAAAATNNNAIAGVTIDCPSLNVETRNYYDRHLSAWQLNVLGGAAVTIQKSATAGRTKFRGTDVYQLVSGIAGTSLTRGYQITATDYPELAGKLMWFGVWVYITDAACYGVPYCDEQTFSDNPTTINTWTLLAVSFTWPAAGTVDIGIRKAGANLGSVWFAAPMVCEVGVPHGAAIALVPTSQEAPLEGSVAYDPPNLADGAGATTTVTVTGAALGDLASCSFSLDLQGITVTSYVSAADTVSVRFQNESGGALDLANGTLRARVVKV